MWQDIASLLWMVHDELLYFAMMGYLIVGMGEVAMDLLWFRQMSRSRWTRDATRPRYLEDLPPPHTPGRIAIFVPAWKEERVIADMLGHALEVWEAACFRIYVGCYQNDLATISQVLALGQSRVRLVYHRTNGPTTKADCLNAIYHAMHADEARHGRFKAILLHDAEDLVHPDELQICDSLSEHYALVQLPVLPLRTRGSPWISGHYLDEFAQAHSRDLCVRQMLGAGIPSAGVATILSRDILDDLATAQNGLPFAVGSLTEDYELGLRIAGLGKPTAFVRIRKRGTSDIVASRAHFPNRLRAATRQKTRWTIGIAFAGWDRLGWTASLSENWMRLRDRQAAFTTLILVAGYAAIGMTAGLYLLAGQREDPPSPLAASLLTVTRYLLVWRLAIRAICVARHYGWQEALIAIPRSFTSNLVLILATHRAVADYRHFLKTGKLIWDKTHHKSPLEP